MMSILIFSGVAGDIHAVKMVLGNRDKCCIPFNLSTRVGRIKNGVCAFSRETNPEQVETCTTHTDGVFFLDGAQLERLIGVGWDCAKTHASALPPARAEGFDEYRLISDSKGHYNDTKPYGGVIRLPLCG